MSGEEKTRVSGEIPRPEPKGPILPAPATDKSDALGLSLNIHPALYVTYVDGPVAAHFPVLSRGRNANR